MPAPVSLRPDYKRRLGDHPLVRIAYARGLAELDPYANGAIGVVAKKWPDDRDLHLATRAAVLPADTVSGSWASPLAGQLTSSFIGTLGPQSAAARLINAGTILSLDGTATLRLPIRTGSPASTLGWVAQGGPIPVKKFSLDAAVLGPACKLGIMAAMTRELAEQGDGQQVLGTLLAEDCVKTLDASMFSTFAGSAVQPKGLLASPVTPITASTGTGIDAMVADLSALSSAIFAAGGGGGGITYIANPKQAQSARLRLLQPIEIWPCTTLAVGSVVGIDASAFVSAFGAIPRVEIADGGAIQYEDTSPAQIGTVGSPNVIAAPTISPWQTDQIVVRVILSAAWVLRQAGMVQVVNSVLW